MDMRSVEFLHPTFVLSIHQARLAMISTASIPKILGQLISLFLFHAEQN